MSQMATYLCKIRNANAETLAYTIEALVGTLNGRIVGTREQQTSIKMPDMEYLISIGIGYNGNIYVTSNKYCDKQKLQKLTKQIEQLYLVIAHKAAMEAMGYQVNIEQNNTGDFIIQGVMG